MFIRITVSEVSVSDSAAFSPKARPLAMAECRIESELQETEGPESSSGTPATWKPPLSPSTFTPLPAREPALHIGGGSPDPNFSALEENKPGRRNKCPMVT